MKAAGPGDTWDMVLISCDIDIVDHGWGSGWRMIMRMRPMLPKMVHAEVQSWKGEAQPCGRDLLELDGSRPVRYDQIWKCSEAYWIRSPSCKLADFVRIAKEVDGTGTICLYSQTRNIGSAAVGMFLELCWFICVGPRTKETQAKPGQSEVFRQDLVLWGAILKWM